MNADTKPEDKYAAWGVAFQAAADAGNDKAARADFSKAVCTELAQNKSKSDTMYLLMLLQMTGGDESLSTLAKLMANPDADISDAARMAVQKNTAPSAAKILDTRLKAERNPVLKSGIVNAMSLRGNKGIIASARKAKEAEIAGATYMANRDWPADEYTKFFDQFNARPSKDMARKGVEGTDDRAFVLVAPYVLQKAGDLTPILKSRYAKSDTATQAWLLTSLAGLPDAKQFIIDSGTAAEDQYVRMAAANALVPYSDEASVKAIFQMMKGAPNWVRDWGYNALSSMKDTKVDAVIIEEAKAMNPDAIRAIGKRGIFEAMPMLIANIRDNKDRGATMEALMDIAGDKEFIEVAKVAVKENDKFLLGRLVNLATNVGKRALDRDSIIKELEALEGTATSDEAKTALGRAKELIVHKGVLPKKD